MMLAAKEKRTYKGRKQWSESERRALVLAVVDEGLSRQGLGKRFGVRTEQAGQQLNRMGFTYRGLAALSREGKSGEEVWACGNRIMCPSRVAEESISLLSSFLCCLGVICNDQDKLWDLYNYAKMLTGDNRDGKSNV